MAVDKNVNLMLHGVGKSQLVFRDNTYITIAESKNIEISVEATEGEIEGGDNPFALLSFITKKTGKITIEDAIMTLPAIKAVTGAEVSNSAEATVIDESHVIATGKATLDTVTGILLDTVLVRVVDTGEFLTKVTGTPAAGEYAITAAGVVTVDTALNGKEIEVSYRYTDATGKAVHMLETDVPKDCELRHKIITDQMEDGKRYQLDITVYRGKPKGSYSYSAKRGEGFAPKLEFSILNAKRKDQRTLSYNVTEYTG